MSKYTYKVDPDPTRDSTRIVPPCIETGWSPSIQTPMVLR